MPDSQAFGQNDEVVTAPAEFGQGDEVVHQSKTFGNHLSDAVSGIWQHMSPVNTATGAAQAVAHPVDFFQNWGKQNGDIAARAEDAFKKGNYAEGVAHSIKYLMNAIPGLGAAAEKSSDSAARGEWGQAIADAVGPPLTLAVYGKAGDWLPPVASKIGGVAKTAASEVLGKTTGAGAAAMRTALENPSADFTNAMRGGVTETDILGHAREALQGVKDARAAEYQARLAAIPQTSPIDITPVRAELGKSLMKHNIRIDRMTGDLDFSRSTIGDASAQNAVRQVYEDVRGWGSQPEDLSPRGVDILKRRIDDLYAPTSNARALVQSVKDATRSTLNRSVPGYQEMTQGYAEASKRLGDLKDLSLESSNSGTAIRKLTTTLNQNNGFRQMLLEGLSNHSPVDISGEVAGLALSRWAPRGIMGPLMGAGASGLLGHGLTPGGAAGLALTSPRMMGELLQSVGGSNPAALAAGAAPAAGFLSVGTSPRLQNVGDLMQGVQR